jgi:hypothetical protein
MLYCQQDSLFLIDQWGGSFILLSSLKSNPDYSRILLVNRLMQPPLNVANSLLGKYRLATVTMLNETVST